VFQCGAKLDLVLIMSYDATHYRLQILIHLCIRHQAPGGFSSISTEELDKIKKYAEQTPPP